MCCWRPCSALGQLHACWRCLSPPHHCPLLPAAGSILINLGTNVIKLGHTRTAALAEGPSPKLLRAPRRWWRTPGNKMWLAGMASFGVGNLLK